MKIISENSVFVSGDRARRRFAEMLRRAFPAISDNDRALQAAPVLGVSDRQVRNWLREENDASARYVFAVMALAGVEMVLNQRGGRE